MIRSQHDGDETYDRPLKARLTRYYDQADRHVATSDERILNDRHLMPGEWRLEEQPLNVYKLATDDDIEPGTYSVRLLVYDADTWNRWDWSTKPTTRRASKCTLRGTNTSTQFTSTESHCKHISTSIGHSILFGLLVSVYTMTSAGKFHIVDEVSLFAVTESLALRGEVDTNAIAWTQWVNSPGEVLGAFGEDGQVYSKKGPAPPLRPCPGT